MDDGRFTKKGRRILAGLDKYLCILYYFTIIFLVTLWSLAVTV
jgi:hypothetical protein